MEHIHASEKPFHLLGKILLTHKQTIGYGNLPLCPVCGYFHLKPGLVKSIELFGWTPKNWVFLVCEPSNQKKYWFSSHIITGNLSELEKEICPVCKGIGYTKSPFKWCQNCRGTGYIKMNTSGNYSGGLNHAIH